MMHLEAIIERNKRPAPRPAQGETLWHEYQHGMAIRSARANKRPWDKPDTMPEAEAHPR